MARMHPVSTKLKQHAESLLPANLGSTSSNLKKPDLNLSMQKPLPPIPKSAGTTIPSLKPINNTDNDDSPLAIPANNINSDLLSKRVSDKTKTTSISASPDTQPASAPTRPRRVTNHFVDEYEFILDNSEEPLGKAWDNLPIPLIVGVPLHISKTTGNDRPVVVSPLSKIAREPPSETLAMSKRKEYITNSRPLTSNFVSKWTEELARRLATPSNAEIVHELKGEPTDSKFLPEIKDKPTHPGVIPKQNANIISGLSELPNSSSLPSEPSFCPAYAPKPSGKLIGPPLAVTCLNTHSIHSHQLIFDISDEYCSRSSEMSKKSGLEGKKSPFLKVFDHTSLQEADEFFGSLETETEAVDNNEPGIPLSIKLKPLRKSCMSPILPDIYCASSAISSFFNNASEDNSNPKVNIPKTSNIPTTSSPHFRLPDIESTFEPFIEPSILEFIFALEKLRPSSINLREREDAIKTARIEETKAVTSMWTAEFETRKAFNELNHRRLLQQHENSL